MKSINESVQLAEELAKVGNCLGIKTSALITRMDYPLGRKIGNSLEVIESLQCLKGKGPKDLEHLVVELGNIDIFVSKFIINFNVYQVVDSC